MRSLIGCGGLEASKVVVFLNIPVLLGILLEFRRSASKRCRRYRCPMWRRRSYSVISSRDITLANMPLCLSQHYPVMPSCDLHMGVTSLSLVLTEKGEGEDEKGEKRANF
jgi:hypothetical protein